jgi:hypothetical protein
MATRKTYENRTQVNVPFSSVPVISPTITAGKGVTVGPAQVQPSKLLNLANALGTVSRATTTIAGIAELEKKQGLRAGELAAKVEEDANDAFLKMEQAGRKAVEAGTLKESQLPSFQFAFKDGIAKRAAGDYNNALVSKLKRVHENLENGRNGQEYAEELTGETYQEFAERFNNDPILLQSFNTAIQGYNRNFSEQVIRSRDKALKENHIKNINSSNATDMVGIINDENIPNDEVRNYFSTKEGGLTEAESVRSAITGVNSAFYRITEGKPTEQKFDRAKELLDNVRESKTPSGVPITNLEEEGAVYYTLRAKLNNYKNLVETTGKLESKKIGSEYANSFLLHVGNFITSGSDEDKDSIKSSLITMGLPVTDEVLNELIDGLEKGYADRVILKLINNAEDLTEAEREVLKEENGRFDSLINQRLELPWTSDPDIEEIGFAAAESLGAKNLPYDAVKIQSVTGVRFTIKQTKTAQERHSVGRRSIIGTTLQDPKTESGIKTRQQSLYDVIEGSIRSEMNGLPGVTPAAITAILQTTSEARREIKDEYIEKVNTSIRDVVGESETEPTTEELDKIRKEAFDAHQPWLKDQYEILKDNVLLEITKPTKVNTQYIMNKFSALEDVSGEVGPIKFPAEEGLLQKKAFLNGTSREYILRVTNQMPLKNEYTIYLEPGRRDEIRNVIGWESPANVPFETKGGDIDWRDVPLFSNAAWTGVDSIWNYDNESSVLRIAETQFESLEGSLPDKNKTPHAYFWSQTFGIHNSSRFKEMLRQQQRLLDGYATYETANKIKDPHREEALKNIADWGSYSPDDIYATPVSRGFSLFGQWPEPEKGGTGRFFRDGSLEGDKKTLQNLDEVYNRSEFYYQMYNNR